MKTLIQLLVVALVVYACVQGGASAWKHVEFKDAVAQEARLGGAETIQKLQQRILEIAAEHEVELDPADLQVERVGTTTHVSASYYDYIELVPRVYTREHLFEFEMSVTPVRPLTAEDFRK